MGQGQKEKREEGGEKQRREMKITFELTLTAISHLFSSRRSSKIEPREVRERAKSGARTKKN